MAAHEASSSSSFKSKLWNYDVFLSFSGEDTRTGFTGHLHDAIEDRGYKVYMDEDDLKRGEEIKEELYRGIGESRISIIVFSKKYADSSWCLDELVKIMECRSKLKRHVLPIFYQVDPSHVRKQNGDLAKAFQNYEEDIREEKDDKKREAKQKRVNQWREALRDAADLAGYHRQITDNRRETKFIREIVDKIITEWLPSTNELDVAKYPVGINSRIQGITSHLLSGGSNVLMVGIWGMGGMGKTTAAKAIYNQIHHKFKFKSFLADVSNTTSKHGLVYLQKTLVSDIMKKKSEISSVDGGISLIKQQFKHRRLLIIMDNIDEVEQLNAIAGNHDWFGPKSRIIITTRDEHILHQVGVDKIYRLHQMNEEEALELFSWHAFSSSRPYEGYLELSRKIVSYCRGLPLALEVLGSFLIKRTIAEWESQLKKLKRTPEGKIINPLRISFEGLDDTQKAIFLDISCFFIGWDKDYVTKVLDGCELCATIGISVLRQRCLVTFERSELNMHDLLREMARVIISERSAGHPERCSRLWDPQLVTEVLIDKSGTEEVEGLALHLSIQDFESYAFSTEAFANMKNLRLLQLINVQLIGEYKHVPIKLIWLCWRGFPLQSIPGDFFNLEKLVFLDMRGSQLVQVWEGSKLLQKLKIIDLSFSFFLIKSPDFSQLPNVEELILEGCDKLSEIHPSIGRLKRLSLVNLTGCKMLSFLPGDFYKSKSVETLLLNGCLQFGEVHEDLGEMISLRILEVDYTAIRKVPPSIVGLKNLTRLSLQGVKGILPYSVRGLNSLRELNLSECELSDHEIPKGLGSLISLQDLHLEENHLHILPSLSGLPKLEILRLNNCYKLRTICDLPTNLKFLHARGCPSLVKMLDFSKMSNMRELDVSDSLELHEVPGLDESLDSMTLIDMKNCTKLTADFMKNILWGIEGVEGLGLHLSIQGSGGYAFRFSTEAFVNMEKPRLLQLSKVKLNGEYKHILKLMWLSWHVSWHECQLKSIPDDFLNQEKLVILDMQWSRLVQVWKGNKSLQKLTIINLSHSVFLQNSPDFSQVPNLEELILEGCETLSEIHPSIGHLKRLSLVNLRCCHKLISLPRDFYKLKSVETLLLNGCSKFIELHEDIGEMISLRTLEAQHTAIREVPPSIGHLKRLSLVNLGYSKLISLPRDFYKLKSVETLILKGCSEFIELDEDIGEMISLITLEAEDTAIREVPTSIVGLKNLTRLSLKGTRTGIQLPHSLREFDLTYGALDDAIKDLGSLIYLQHLRLLDNEFHSLPNLSGLSKLETLWLNGSRYLRTIPDLPTNLKVLFADDCPALETMPDFSEMSNMRELDVSNSAKLTEVPGLDKSLYSMTWIDMHGCPNLTADFRKNILQGWTSCGFGGIFLHGNYVPNWFEFVNEGTKISFDIPPSDGRNFKGLTMFCSYSSRKRTGDPECLVITVTKNTKRIQLQAYMGKDRKRISYKPKSLCIWQGQLSNDKLNLQGGDRVEVGIAFSYARVNRIGVDIAWDKPMKENMHDLNKVGYGSVVRHNQGGDASSSSSWPSI